MFLTTAIARRAAYLFVLVILTLLSGEIIRGRQINFTFKTESTDTLIRGSAIGGLPYTIFYSDLIRRGNKNIDECMSRYNIKTYHWNFDPRAPIKYEIGIDVTYRAPWSNLFSSREDNLTDCIEEFFLELNSNAIRMTQKVAEETCIRVPYYPFYEIKVSNQTFSEFDFLFFTSGVLITMLGLSRPMTALTILTLVILLNLGLRDPQSRVSLKAGTVYHMPLFIFGYFSHNHINCTNLNIAPRYKWIYIGNAKKDEYRGNCDVGKLIPKRPEDSNFYKNELRNRPLIYLVWNHLLEHQTVTVE